MKLLPESKSIGRAFVDWLAFTVPCDSLLEQGRIVAEWEKRLGGGVERESSMYFYAKAVKVLESGLILYHPERLNMGVHVSLPASALAKVGIPVTDFLLSIKAFQGTVKRIDVAVDCDHVHIEEVLQSIEAGELVSKSHNRLLVRKLGQPGMTIYIGSSASMRRVRIYDKAAEQGSDGVWTRCEVQLRKEHAQTAADEILAGVDPTEIVASSLDFRTVNGDSNVARHERVAWWDKWLTYCQGVVSFSLEHVDATVDSMRNWIASQVAPTLGFLSIIEAGDMGWLYEVITDGVEKLPPWKVARGKKLSVAA